MSPQGNSDDELAVGQPRPYLKAVLKALQLSYAAAASCTPLPCAGPDTSAAP